MMQDALRKALSGKALEARTPSAAPSDAPGGPDLPHPRDSEWARLLPDLPADASIGRYRQETTAQLKAWKQAGRKRDVRALSQARDKFEKQYDKAAWKVVKQRWSELGYPDRLYRRLKGEKLDTAKLVDRLHTRRADAMAEAPHDTLWTWITTGRRPS